MLIKRLAATAILTATGAFAWGMNDVGIEHQTVILTAQFSRGASPGLGYQTVLNTAADHMKDNDSYVAVIEGHTGTRGPANNNLTLSEERARRVADDLRRLGIDLERVFVYAAGEQQPLTQQDGESDTDFQSRLNRVEIYIIHEALDQETVL